MTDRADNKKDILMLPEIVIGKSLGAKARNYDISLPSGEVVCLTEGTRITNVEVIAGKRSDRKIDEIDRLVEEYGGNSNEWQKVKGYGFVDYDGGSLKAELHWYQEPSVGRILWKVKVQKGGEYFID